MQKSQIVILLIACVTTGVLFALPKVLVTDGKEAGPGKEVTKPASGSAAETPEQHQAEMSPLQQARLEKLERSFRSSKDNIKKSIFADSLAKLLSDNNLPDSAAWYLEQVALMQPSTATWTKAGDGFYEAFRFTADASKAARMGAKAREYYQKVLTSEPDALEVKSKMAMTYTATANPMQGIAMLREILEQDPGNVLAQLNLGMLSMQSGQYDKAVGRFEQILAKKPEHVEANMYLGVSYAALGRKEEARKILLRLKSLRKEDAAVQAIADQYLKELN